MISGHTPVRPRAPLSWAIAAMLAVAAPGCATEGAQPSETGTLVLPLVTPGPDGALFHLANATFDISALRSDFVTTVDGSGLDPTVSVTAPPGLVQIFLRDGWRLEKSTDGGATFEPVAAVLGSINPNAARVLVNVPVTVQFDFLVHDANGTLQIKLGVTEAPRELAGGYDISTATGALSPYAEFVNRRLDFGVFYDLFSVTTETLADGTKQRVYQANHVGVEFYNDTLGVFSGQVAPALSGAFLTYTVAARPDGTFELTGELAGGGLDSFSDLRFGPSVIDSITSPTLDAEGFPNDEFFYDSESPFTHDIDFETITGVLRVRHLIPGSPGPRQ